jgi:hypothetical protein
MVPVLADAAPTVSYTGRTSEDQRMVLAVRDRVVVRVSTRIGRYRCATFGDVGPIAVAERVHARVGRDGRFRFTVGETAQRLTVTGVLRRATHAVAGTVRLRGSIATGQACASATLRYRAAVAVAQDR